METPHCIPHCIETQVDQYIINFQAIFTIKFFVFVDITFSNYVSIDAYSVSIEEYNALINYGPKLDNKNHRGQTALMASMHFRKFLKKTLRKLS